MSETKDIFANIHPASILPQDMSVVAPSTIDEALKKDEKIFSSYSTFLSSYQLSHQRNDCKDENDCYIPKELFTNFFIGCVRSTQTMKIIDEEKINHYVYLSNASVDPYNFVPRDHHLILDPKQSLSDAFKKAFDYMKDGFTTIPNFKLLLYCFDGDRLSTLLVLSILCKTLNISVEGSITFLSSIVSFSPISNDDVSLINKMIVS